MSIFRASALPLILLLAGCVTTSQPIAGDTCGASKWQGYVGKPVSQMVSQLLRRGAPNGFSIYGESIAAGGPSKDIKLKNGKPFIISNKYEVSSKKLLLIIHEDKNGRIPYAGSDPKAEFLGAVENKITHITCGRR